MNPAYSLIELSEVSVASEEDIEFCETVLEDRVLSSVVDIEYIYSLATA